MYYDTNMSKEFIQRILFEYRKLFLYIGLFILGLILMKVIQMAVSPKPAAPVQDSTYEERLRQQQ
jgi:hypothetical protein